ncbi:zinc finger protein 271-like [Onthophagus taurus]|uniref:zinc finger protein 271-like n=1 Tax=Onthophagus taurus TaxID=166361 RepID=UPI000C203503|nr:zinc finger protein 271-like [Onthophagus taurus]
MEESKSMTFVCQEMASSMFQKLFEQKKSNRFCDLTLYVNNRIIKAHRSVLACGSPYFDSILKHHKIVREELTVNCLDVDILDTIINFMYTGQISIEYSNVEELLKLADYFIMTKVIEYCIEFLGTKLSLYNCLFTYNLTQSFKLKQLGHLVENWIITHINEVCDGGEILNLNCYELQDFLRNKVFVIPVYKALRIISDWVLKNQDVREKDFLKLLYCIQWNIADQNDIFKHVETCPLYGKSELCFFFFLTALAQNNILTPNFKNRYDVLSVKYEHALKIDDRNDNYKQECRISVMEKDSSVCSSSIVKAKQKNRKQQLLKRLMFGLKPSLRMAALKLFTNKKKSITENIIENGKESESDEKVGVKCPVCFTNINDSLLLEQHLALSHAKDVTYKCGICNFVCQYHGDYLNHMKTHFSGPPFKCDYCDFSNDQIAKLISHRAKHLQESFYQCTFCSFKCRQKQNFVAHLKIHTPEKTHKCDTCSKSFKYKHNLENHVQTHNNMEKSLSCDSCGFHTKYMSHMIAHKRIHAGDIYRCSYPHCKYSTSKKNQLATHAKTHNGVRPHSCTICGRGFMEKSHLVRHERIHLEEKPFKCSSCDYASSRRDKLKEHFTRHHGENASAKVPYKARPMRNNPRPKSQPPQENATANGNVSFPTANNNSSSTVTQPIGTEIQDLIMHHQNHPISSTTGNIPAINPNYHHFGDPADFHHHSHAHNIQHQILASGHNQRISQHSNNVVNHHMLGRGNHSTATSTAAAVAAAMMLDPRFHHNSTVPYHPTTTPVSMAMAAVQSSQQIQGSSQHGEYPPSLQNCMTLF